MNIKKNITYYLCSLILIVVSSCGSDSSTETPGASPVLQSISVKTPPQKTVYVQNEALDLTGLEVVGTYSDESVLPIQVTVANISGFATDTPADERPVTITVEGKTTSFNIKVLPATLESISVKTLPAKVVYTLDEPFVSDGLELEGKYSDGQTRTIAFTADNFSGYSAGTPAETLAITVTVEGKSASFEVKVLPLKVVQGVVTEAKEGFSEIVFPKGVTSIADNVFKNRGWIKKVVLNEGLTSIGEDAFLGSGLEEITFPASLATINSYAFYRCLSLKVVDLSKTQLTVIRDNSFSRSGITQLKLPSTLLEIESQAFIETASLGALELPEGLKSIGSEAFRESGLPTLRLPNSISFLAQRVFYYCPNLTEVRTYGALAEPLPNSAMEAYCFAGSSALAIFEIPKSIRKIGQGILGSSTNVTAVTIPAGVTNIDFSAFNNTPVRNVVVEAVVPPAVRQVAGYWYGFPENVERIAVPAGSVDAYKTANGWKDFSSKIVSN